MVGGWYLAVRSAVGDGRLVGLFGGHELLIGGVRAHACVCLCLLSACACVSVCLDVCRCLCGMFWCVI